MNKRLFILWCLLFCVVTLLVAGWMLQRKNHHLTEANSKLLLQNDSVLSVNLHLQKQLLHLQQGLDSVEQHQAQNQRITSR